MKIDAHQHFWRLADRAGQWLPAELAAIHRDFVPADLRPLLQSTGIEATVLVQSLPSVRDTEFLLALADAHDFIRAVVGWVDLKAADAPAQIERLARHPRLRGLRPMLQDLSETEWILDPALAPAIDTMRRHGLVFDALVLPRHLPALATFALRFPSLSIVVDHAAKPGIGDRAIEPWAGDMARLAALPQVHCKLSGLLTEARPGDGVEALRPYVQTLWQLFGPERLLWGSDWPVLTLATGYPEWLALAEALLDAMNPPADARARAALFGDNAARVYRLAESRPPHS